VEVQLAKRLQAGDDSAFQPFAELVWAKIFNFGMLMCRQREDAEEIAQDTVMAAYQKLGELRDPEGVRAWIFRIAKNACLMTRRRSMYEPAIVSLDTGEDTAMDVADGTALPDQQILLTEKMEALKEALVQLPETSREVFLLRHVEGLNTEETAYALGLSEDLVKQRLRRARVAIQASLNRHDTMP
jgi:RNA polymerase sigma-70 factor (ECF subfamily)